MTTAEKILDFFQRSGLMDKLKQQIVREQQQKSNVIYFSEISRPQQKPDPWDYYSDIRNTLPFYPDFLNTLREMELYTLDSQVNFCCAVMSMLRVDLPNILQHPEQLDRLLL